MPTQFSSTTANSNYSLFVSPREAAFINDIVLELFEIVSKQNFIYWAVERQLTDTDDLYGEAEHKIPKNPVQVYGFVMLNEPIVTTNRFTTETKRRLDVFLHIDRLTEIGIYPRQGDFIEWDSQFHEIIAVTVPKFVQGLPEVKIGVNITAISTRENIFAPRNTQADIDDSIPHDVQNPY